MKPTNDMQGTILQTKEAEQEGHKFTYRLIRRESRSTASYRLALYSIRVDMTTPEGEDVYAEVTDIFADPGRAIAFYELVSRNLATSKDLPYILEDEIG